MNRHTEHFFCFGLIPCVTRGRALAGKLAVALAPLLAAGESLEAEVHLVPADRDAIQGAIDAAVPGDRIVVAPGECPVSEPINLRGKAITLESENGPEETVLVYERNVPVGVDGCTVSRSIIVLDSGEPPETVVAGFTLRNGGGGTGTVIPLSFWCQGGEGFIDAGGGMLIRNGSTPTIVRCRFEEHLAGHGAALASLIGWMLVSLIATMTYDN